jgi:hypothetical protein
MTGWAKALRRLPFFFSFFLTPHVGVGLQDAMGKHY